MSHFTIDWKLTDRDYSYVTTETVSELKLSNVWTVLCFWGNVKSDAIAPHCVVFHRTIDSDKISIAGTLSLVDDCSLRPSASHHKEPTQRFSKYMESGRSSIMINLKNPDSVSSSPVYFLRGAVIIISTGVEHTAEAQSEESRKCDHSNSLVVLSDELKNLLVQETCCFSDVKLKCGNASIPAHKNILSARSPVFAAMFKNSTEENRKNEVDAGDVDAHVLRTMLTYIYTGETSDLSISSASELLFASNKYQLHDLRRVCREFLKDNICLENAFRILVLGDMHDEDLKASAVNYISNEGTFSILKNTEEWKALEQKRRDLSLSISAAVFSRKKLKTIKIFRKNQT